MYPKLLLLSWYSGDSARFLPDLFTRAGIATFAGLLCGNIAMIAIILVSGIQGVNQTPEQILAGLSLVAAITMGVAVIEALMTGMVVASIDRMRPDRISGKNQ